MDDWVKAPLKRQLSWCFQCSGSSTCQTLSKEVQPGIGRQAYGPKPIDARGGSGPSHPIPVAQISTISKQVSKHTVRGSVLRMGLRGYRAVRGPMLKRRMSRPGRWQGFRYCSVPISRASLNQNSFSLATALPRVLSSTPSSAVLVQCLFRTSHLLLHFRACKFVA